MPRLTLNDAELALGVQALHERPAPKASAVGAPDPARVPTWATRIGFGS